MLKPLKSAWLWLFMLVFCCGFSTLPVAAQQAPQILDLAYQPAPFDAQSGIEVLPKMLEADNNDVRFFCRWFVNGEEVPEFQEVLLPGEFFRRGDVIRVEVTPETGGLRGRAVRSGEVEAGNAPPRILTEPPEDFSQGVYSYQIEAQDADGDFLTYTLIGGPPGMQLEEESGQLHWTITEWQEGAFVVTVLVSDGFGGEDQQQFTMNSSFVSQENTLEE